jgi:hypothetical protein
MPLRQGVHERMKISFSIVSAIQRFTTFLLGEFIAIIDVLAIRAAPDHRPFIRISIQLSIPQFPANIVEMLCYMACAPSRRSSRLAIC